MLKLSISHIANLVSNNFKQIVLVIIWVEYKALKWKINSFFIAKPCATKKYLRSVIMNTITHHTWRLPRNAVVLNVCLHYLYFWYLLKNAVVPGICPKHWYFWRLPRNAVIFGVCLKMLLFLAFLAFAYQISVFPKRLLSRQNFKLYYMINLISFD